MHRNGNDKPLTLNERRGIFKALVEAQDRMEVVRSRQVVSERYGVSEHQLRQIEQEGLEGEWPPL